MRELLVGGTKVGKGITQFIKSKHLYIGGNQLLQQQQDFKD